MLHSYLLSGRHLICDDLTLKGFALKLPLCPFSEVGVTFLYWIAMRLSWQLGPKVQKKPISFASDSSFLTNQHKFSSLHRLFRSSIACQDTSEKNCSICMSYESENKSLLISELCEQNTYTHRESDRNLNKQEKCQQTINVQKCL